MRLFITFLCSMCLVAAGALSVTTSAWASSKITDAEIESAKKWQGEGDIGLYISSGNTKASSLRSQLKLLYHTGSWSHESALEAINASAEGQRTAESYMARQQSNYALSKSYYLFGNGRYENNRFSGYEYQSSMASGLGLKLVSSSRILLSVEGGVGYKRNKEIATEVINNEAIYLGAAKYHYQLTDTARLESNWRVETGDESTYLEENTYMEAVLALSVKMTDIMALKLGYTVKHNTDVPEEIEDTDRLTSLSLNFQF